MISIKPFVNFWTVSFFADSLARSGRRLVVTCLAAISLSVAASAALAESSKIAVVDVEKAIFTTDAAERRIENLQSRSDYVRQKKAVTKLQKEGRTKTEKFRKNRDVMSELEREKMRKKLRILSQDVEYEVKKLKEMEREVLVELYEELAPRAQEIIEGLIKMEEIGLLLRRNAQVPVVFYADTRFDLTAKVTDRLNRDKPSKRVKK